MSFVAVARDAQHDAAIDRERLKNDVQAAAVGVLECSPDRKPKVLLAFAADGRVGAERRFRSESHWKLRMGLDQGVYCGVVAIAFVDEVGGFEGATPVDGFGHIFDGRRDER